MKEFKLIMKQMPMLRSQVNKELNEIKEVVSVYESIRNNLTNLASIVSRDTQSEDSFLTNDNIIWIDC